MQRMERGRNSIKNKWTDLAGMPLESEFRNHYSGKCDAFIGWSVRISEVFLQACVGCESNQSQYSILLYLDFDNVWPLTSTAILPTHC